MKERPKKDPSSGVYVICWKRQFSWWHRLFNIADLARLFIWVLREYEEVDPIILASDQEVSIKEVALLIRDAFQFKGTILYLHTVRMVKGERER
jgi:hypothetical protein